MPVTRYDYTKSPVDIDRLKLEIEQSSIVIALSHIDYDGSNLSIYFKDALSTADKSTLDSIVSSHTGEPLKIKQPEPVMVMEQFQEGNVLGRYQASCFRIDVQSGVGSVSTLDFSFPIDICIYSASMVPTPSMEGDFAEFLIAPDTAVGQLAQDLAANSDFFVADNTALQYLSHGYFVKISDGTNIEDLGRVTKISGDNVFVEKKPTLSFAAGSAILMTVKLIHNFEIFGDKRLDFGSTKIGGATIRANTPMRLVYINNEGSAKKIRFMLEYTY